MPSMIGDLAVDMLLDLLTKDMHFDQNNRVMLPHLIVILAAQLQNTQQSQLAFSWHRLM